MYRSLALLVLCATVGSCGPSSDRAPDVVITPVLPADAAGWIADGEGEAYDTESIYAYIDGHAEVYMAYGMKRCLSRRYAAPAGDAEIVVDLFEMESPADAFGVFSHDRAGEEVAVGRGGVFRHGWLSFWQSSWYGSVYATASDETTRETVLAIGRIAADALPRGGEPPQVIHRLPIEELDPTSICFLHSPQILNAHVNVGPDDPFGIGPGVVAAVGAYTSNGTDARLVLVEYGNEAAAVAVETRFRADGDAAAGRPPMIVGRRGATVAAVVGSETGEWGENLLERALGGGA